MSNRDTSSISGLATWSADNLNELRITVDSEREYGKTVIQDNLPGEFMPLGLSQAAGLQARNLTDAVDRVKMMTVHAAKDLSFGMFVVGMTDGISSAAQWEAGTGRS